MNDSRCLSRLESARVGITMVAPVVVSSAHARRSITHRGSIVTSARLHSSSPLKRHWPWPALNIRKRGPLTPRRPRNLIGFAAISKRPSASVTTSRKSCKLVKVPCHDDHVRNRRARPGLDDPRLPRTVRLLRWVGPGPRARRERHHDERDGNGERQPPPATHPRPLYLSDFSRTPRRRSSRRRRRPPCCRTGGSPPGSR